MFSFRLGFATCAALHCWHIPFIVFDAQLRLQVRFEHRLSVRQVQIWKF